MKIGSKTHHRSIHLLETRWRERERDTSSPTNGHKAIDPSAIFIRFKLHPRENWYISWKLMIGRWDFRPFSGDMLIFRAGGGVSQFGGIFVKMLIKQGSLLKTPKNPKMSNPTSPKNGDDLCQAKPPERTFSSPMVQYSALLRETNGFSYSPNFQESYNTPVEHTPGNPLSQLWKESLHSLLVIV